MDFHSLARRDLQALCKRNKIPANQTNLAMADALQALAIVEGMDDFLNQTEPSVESPEKVVEPSSAVPRTGGRTSTRRKPIQEVPQSTAALTRTRRGTRKTENGDAPETPAVPCSRKKAPMTRRKMETQFDEEAEEEKKASKTPAVRTTRRTAASVQNVNTARRSTRTLEKQLMGMDLNEKKETSMDVDENAKEDSDDKATDQEAVSDDILVKTGDSEDVKEKPEETMEVIDASDIQKDETVDPEVNEENKDEDLSKMEVAVDASDVVASDNVDDSSVLEVEIPEEIGTAVEPVSAVNNQTESVILESEEGSIADKEPVVESDMLEDSDNKDLINETQKQDMELLSLVDSKESSTAETNLENNIEDAEAEHSSDSEQSEKEEEDLTEPESEEDVEDEVPLAEDISKGGEIVVEEVAMEEDKEEDLTESESEEDAEDEVHSYPLVEDISKIGKTVDEEVVMEDKEEELTESEPEEDSEDEVESETDDKEVEMEDNFASKTSDSEISVPVIPSAETAAPTPVKKTPLKAASTPMKNSPFKALATSQNMIEVLDENVDGPEKEPLEEEVNKKSSESIVELGNDISLRQLRKLFKTKLQISKEGKNIAEVGGGKRPALQELPENCLTASEIERA